MNVTSLIKCFAFSLIALSSCKPKLEKSYKDEELTQEISDLRRLYVYINHFKEVRGVNQISIHDLRDEYPDIGLGRREGGKQFEKWTYHERPKKDVIAITRKDFDGVFLQLMSDGQVRKITLDTK